MNMYIYIYIELAIHSMLSVAAGVFCPPLLSKFNAKRCRRRFLFLPFFKRFNKNIKILNLSRMC